MTSTFAAKVFAGLISVVCLFQIALALGAPWGALAMGGGAPGVYPVSMRLAAGVQCLVLAAFAVIVLSRAGLAFARWRPLAGRAVWGVVGLLGVSLVLNLITPSALERMIWAPVALALFLSALRVASRR
jgi:hypothetical protein